MQKIEKKTRSSCSRSACSKSSSSSSSSKSLKLSAKERAIKEKVQLADLQAEGTFMQKKGCAELQAESLQIEEERQKHKPELRSMKEKTQNLRYP